MESKLNKIQKAIDDKKILLGVGPMSLNCVNATIEVANRYNIPIMIIASRRQIERAELGGGYVTNTDILAKHVKIHDYKKNVILVRDHGGPWQGNDESELDHNEALKRACISYEADIESGFDILHLDPSLKQRPLSEIIKDIQYLYEFCNNKKSNLIYEAGTEEHNGQITKLQDFEYFVETITKQNSLIKFVVGNMGLLVKETRNVGFFDKAKAKQLVEICNKNNLFLKGHNTDYVDDYTLKKHLDIGVHSINVAPEFGVIETCTLLDLLRIFGMKKQRQEFIDLAVESRKWEKWMVNNSIMVPSDFYKAKICGHYIFEHPKVKQIKCEMMKKCDIDLILKDNVAQVIKEYLSCLGWDVT